MATEQWRSLLPVTRQTVSCRMRDGVRLDADLYRPETDAPLPVLLMRQPYGRAIASTVVYAHPRWYAAQGYLVVMQDVRGRGSSEGEFRLFEDERNDGQDSLHWAAQLPGSNGRVGMYGFSYQGMTQLYAAEARLDCLKVICPAMLAGDLHRHWAYEGGAFRLQLNLAWAIQLAAESARRRGDAESYRRLAQAAANLPLGGDRPDDAALLAELEPESFYFDWLRETNPDSDYWQCLNPRLDGIDLPMLHIGGWFDPYLRGTIDLFERLWQQSAQPQQLWVGPWAHLPWGRALAGQDYGPEACSPIDRVQLAWFDHYLKDGPLPLQSEPLQLFDLGTRQWRSLPDWPQGTCRWYLDSNGLAGMRQDDGRLQPQPPSRAVEDWFVHDPWRPVPALGGHNSFSVGSPDRRELDSRSDLLVYRSAPLSVPLTLVGPIRVELSVETEVPSLDLQVVLSRETASGSVQSLSQGFRRLCPSRDGQPLGVDLQPICCTCEVGDRLRLSLAAAAWPAFAVNPGTGQDPHRSRRIEALPYAVGLRHGPDGATRLQLAML